MRCSHSVTLIAGGSSVCAVAALFVFAAPERVCAVAVCARQKAANTSTKARAEIGIGTVITGS
jgi:hypothetical protein